MLEIVNSDQKREVEQVEKIISTFHETPLPTSSFYIDRYRKYFQKKKGKIFHKHDILSEQNEGNRSKR